MALGVSILNMIWIPLYGIDGAALATLVVVGVSIVVKIIYLQFKIKANPLSWNLFKALIAVGILYTLFQYIEWTFSPLVQIGLTSTLVSALYFLIVSQFKLSDDLLRLLNRIGK
jgi:O-antigen/teichoic acid export membrane protein